MLGYVGAGLAVIFLSLLLYAYISSRLSESRIKRHTKKLLPEIDDYFQANKVYRVTLSNGKTFEQVTFLGISPSFGSNPDFLPFPLQRWVVLQSQNGKRLFLKPQSIRFYEEI